MTADKAGLRVDGMKATLDTPPPPPATVTLTMSLEEAKVLRAIIEANSDALYDAAREDQYWAKGLTLAAVIDLTCDISEAFATLKVVVP